MEFFGLISSCKILFTNHKNISQMKIYDDKHIKNVVLVGAPKSGKTTLAEAMIFEAGLINRRGTVEEKNTVSDYHLRLQHAT